MKKTNVLVVGGYGIVGKVVSEILSRDQRISLTISGRNQAKAKVLAEKLNADWLMVDLTDQESIVSALTNVDIVINCFAGPFTYFHLSLPEMALQRGIHYLDVAGSYEYTERFLQLNAQAAKNKSILITSLGANPGIPGILLMNAKHEFDEIDLCRIYFIIGAKFDGISISSLKELKYMFDVEPLVWDQTQWSVPLKKSLKEYIGKPFVKEVYMGLSLTRDLVEIPKLLPIQHLSFWSGAQSAFQGLLMMVGLKTGMTRNDYSTRLLHGLLKKMGSSKSAIADVLIKVDITGRRNGVECRKVSEMYCDENYATAIAPSIVCQQIIEEKISRYGAFVPPEVVPAADFLSRLEKYETSFSCTSKSL